MVSPGDRFGRLVVIERVPNPTGAKSRCQCDCGGFIEVFHSNLKRYTNSCGCLRREKGSERGKLAKKHGYTRTRTYQSWRAMKKRCYLPQNPSYDYYGARGIRVCKRWYHSFEAFLADMGERPEGMTLDRIDPSGNYTPSNCRWATPATQAMNQRRFS